MHILTKGWILRFNACMDYLRGRTEKRNLPAIKLTDN